jgi:hypothetical protein
MCRSLPASPSASTATPPAAIFAAAFVLVLGRGVQFAHYRKAALVLQKITGFSGTI